LVMRLRAAVVGTVRVDRFREEMEGDCFCCSNVNP